MKLKVNNSMKIYSDKNRKEQRKNNNSTKKTKT